MLSTYLSEVIMVPAFARPDNNNGTSPKALFRLIASILFFSGCVAPLYLYSKPHVDETGSWRIYEECGYLGCAAKVGFLTGEGIRIRIEAYNHNGGDWFSIRTWFVADKNIRFSIDPSKAHVEFADSSIAYAKAFRAGFTEEEVAIIKSQYKNLDEFMKVQKPVTEAMALKEYWYKDEVAATFMLKFEVAPPPPEEEFYLYIKGLNKDGKEVNIPKITFRPATRRGGGGKLIPE
jgi:hypothetical protein